MRKEIVNNGLIIVIFVIVIVLILDLFDAFEEYSLSISLFCYLILGLTILIYACTKRND